MKSVRSSGNLWGRRRGFRVEAVKSALRHGRFERRPDERRLIPRQLRRRQGRCAGHRAIGNSALRVMSGRVAVAMAHRHRFHRRMIARRRRRGSYAERHEQHRNHQRQPGEQRSHVQRIARHVPIIQSAAGEAKERGGSERIRTASSVSALGSEAPLKVDTGGNRLELANALAEIGDLDPPRRRRKPAVASGLRQLELLEVEPAAPGLEARDARPPRPAMMLPLNTAIVSGSIISPPAGALRFRAPAVHSGC